MDQRYSTVQSQYIAGTNNLAGNRASQFLMGSDFEAQAEQQKLRQTHHMKKSEWYAKQQNDTKIQLAGTQSTYQPRDTLGTLSRDNAFKPAPFQSQFIPNDRTQTQIEKDLNQKMGILKFENNELKRKIDELFYDKKELESTLASIEDQNKSLISQVKYM